MTTTHTYSRPGGPHLVVGLGFIFLGTVLLLDRIGIVDAAKSLQFWPVLLVLFGVSILVRAVRPADPAATTGANTRSPAGWFWLLILIFVVASGVTRRHQERGRSSDAAQLFAIWGSDERSSFTPSFRGAEMTSFMGQTSLDLRTATIEPGETPVVDVFTVWGRSTIRLPPEWVVDIHVTPFMGAVKDERRSRNDQQPGPSTGPSAPRPRIVIQGNVTMGQVEIR